MERDASTTIQQEKNGHKIDVAVPKKSESRMLKKCIPCCFVADGTRW
jgi:hypothetical protein